MKAIKKPANWLEKRSNSISSVVSVEAHHAAHGVAAVWNRLRPGTPSHSDSFRSEPSYLSDSGANDSGNVSEVDTVPRTAMQKKRRGRMCRRKSSVQPATAGQTSARAIVTEPDQDSDSASDDGPAHTAVDVSSSLTGLLSAICQDPHGGTQSGLYASLSTTVDSIDSSTNTAPSLTMTASHSTSGDSDASAVHSENQSSSPVEETPMERARLGARPSFNRQRSVYSVHHETLDALSHIAEGDNSHGKGQATVSTEPASFQHGPNQRQTDIEPLLDMDFLEARVGKWPVEHEGEHIVSTCSAMLIRQVLVRGVLAFTNCRLVFWAYVASDHDLDEDTVILDGALIMHFEEKWKAKRRIFVTMTPVGVAYYASATDRLKPIGARSFGAFKQIYMKPNSTTSYICEMVTGAKRELEFDTPEDCSKWFAEFNKALFHYRNQSDHVTVSIPWSRIEEIKYESMLDFAKIVQLEVDCAVSEYSDAGEHPHREVLFGINKYSYSALGHFEELFKANSLFEQDHGEDLVHLQPPCTISIEVSTSRNDDDHHVDAQSESDIRENFVREFGLQESPDSLYIVKADVIRTLPDYGHMAVSDNYVCFWRKNHLSTDARIRIPIADIEGAVPCKVFRLRVWGLALHIRATLDQHFEFNSILRRDNTINEIRFRMSKHWAPVQLADSPHTSTSIERIQSRHIGGRDDHRRSPSGSSTPDTPAMEQYSPDLTLRRTRSPTSLLSQTGSADQRAEQIHAQLMNTNIRSPTPLLRSYPAIVNLDSHLQRPSPRSFVLLTIGSRGDVQPYIALGKRLLVDGHQVKIASHEEYREWATSHGLEYAAVGGDPTLLMQLSTEHRMFSPGFFSESLGKFKKWFDDLLTASWDACQGADVIVESPSTFAGVHVAEALAVPYFRAFTMPWTATGAYPQAFAPILDAGPAYNQMSYALFDRVLWQASSGQINKWRKDTLKLKSTTLEKLESATIPFIYNFSSAVVPRPLDWTANIHISGYWFLDESQKGWQPDEKLLTFMQSAKEASVPLVWIGFGSITIKNIDKVRKHIFEAVAHAGVRAIVGKGWSARGQSDADSSGDIAPVATPDCVYEVDSIPHDWLFPKIDAAFHHGGAGSTGASLRAGLPTLIKPFFGDQHFWATRVQKLGAGLRVPNLSTPEITKALLTATTDRVMREKAQLVGTKIRSEDGCRNAMAFIYQYLEGTTQRAHERHRRGTIVAEPVSPAHITHAAEVEQLERFISRIAMPGKV